MPTIRPPNGDGGCAPHACATSERNRWRRDGGNGLRTATERNAATA